MRKLIKGVQTHLPRFLTWQYAVFFFLAAYLVLDLMAYMHNPYSGRIYSLECKKEQNSGSVCHATTYGWLKKSTLTFRAEDYQRSQVLWEFPSATSDSLVSGVLIFTKGFNFEFIPVTQPASRSDHTLERVQSLFSGDLASVEGRIWHFGVNYPASLRFLFLLLFWVLVDFESRIGKFTGSLRIGEQTRSEFIFAWWKANSLAKILLVLLIIILKGGASFGFGWRYWDFLGSCYSGMQLADYCGACAVFPFGKFWCLYPVLTLGSLIGLLQWRTLKTRMDLSKWWVAIPGLASLWLFLTPFSLTCQACQSLQGLVIPYLVVEIPPINFVYAFLLGVGQWLLLRKHIPLSMGWIVLLVAYPLLPLLSALLFDLMVIPIVLILMVLFSFLDIFQAWLLLKAMERQPAEKL